LASLEHTLNLGFRQVQFQLSEAAVENSFVGLNPRFVIPLVERMIYSCVSEIGGDEVVSGRPSPSKMTPIGTVTRERSVNDVPGELCPFFFFVFGLLVSTTPLILAMTPVV